MTKPTATKILDRYQTCRATGRLRRADGATRDTSGKRLTHSYEPGPRR